MGDQDYEGEEHPCCALTMRCEADFGKQHTFTMQPGGRVWQKCLCGGLAKKQDDGRWRCQKCEQEIVEP